MRQVVGKIVRDLDAASFQALRAGYRELVLDLGTGDGKHVLSVARQRPDALVVGVDAGPDAMRPTARTAARKPAKGGLANALFLWAAVEGLPAELINVDEVHVLMPWGSLLRAFVEPDETVLREIAQRCRPSAPFLITVNLHAWRPPVPEVGPTPEPTPDSAIQSLAPAYARAGWRIESAAYLSETEIDQLGTSWTKRLGSSRTDLAVLCLRGAIS
ncbi:MAG TPA: class I SAM-dependent methyltransferase [Jatrophihabitans sp.]|nr:class I SAM-dependent methyltransferase [Jatrophihabitans sp.]